jgi:RND superfamily putative drug exporter
MHMLGPANWWLPGWLDRLVPHVSVEPADAPAASPAPAPRPLPVPVVEGADV